MALCLWPSRQSRCLRADPGAAGKSKLSDHVDKWHLCFAGGLNQGWGEALGVRAQSKFPWWPGYRDKLTPRGPHRYPTRHLHLLPRLCNTAADSVNSPQSLSPSHLWNTILRSRQTCHHLKTHASAEEYWGVTTHSVNSELQWKLLCNEHMALFLNPTVWSSQVGKGGGVNMILGSRLF